MDLSFWSHLYCEHGSRQRAWDLIFRWSCEKYRTTESPETGREKYQTPSSSSLSILTFSDFHPLALLGQQSNHFTLHQFNLTKFILHFVVRYCISFPHWFSASRLEVWSWNICLLGIGVYGAPSWVPTFEEPPASVEPPTCYIWTTVAPSMQRVRWTTQTPLLKIQGDGLQLLTLGEPQN